MAVLYQRPAASGVTARARQVSQLSGYDLDTVYAARTPDRAQPPCPDLE